jgi:hypothetical protein
MIWFEALREIADLDLQRQRWLDPANSNPHWSYVEFVCKYPDSDQLMDGSRRNYLSPAEATVLQEFGEMLYAHKSPNGNNYNHEAILNDPAWQEVVRAAGAALKRLEALQP